MIVVWSLIAAALVASMVWCVTEVIKDIQRWIVFFREKKEKESRMEDVAAPEIKPEEEG